MMRMMTMDDLYEAKCEKALAVYPDLCATHGYEYVFRYMEREAGGMGEEERQAWRTKVRRLTSERVDLIDLLERAAEVLNGYADVRDSGDDRPPRPNDAMSMESEILAFLQEASRV